ncbi:proline--tRNA ligase [Enteractinococcus coprophilus]|uniref:Proline--tRNA ligase n=1 Tax=Enteractinococcus coprophilus TaxID=1027633 RepID=A0A543AK54_9MICC|nr:proline--tRNA ligase [Enteractinococcus coprophilus]TQL72953.1 prolyl-tRNA synthetase [Enteractinococcus coprophilus]
MPLRMSTLFLRTLRDDPADAEVASHKLLVRAGYIRRAAPGGYTWLPLGLRVKNKVENIVREEMNAIGGQEVHFPALLPKEPYEATGRWEDYGDGIFRLQDRSGADFLLAPTHEEMFTLLVKDHYSSYKDLPVYLYQIQTKYRDEARPRAGLLRVREFIMKDSYSFTVNDEGLNEAYDKHRAAYIKIFERLGLNVVAVEAMAGAMGGSRSEEFLHPSGAGEDTFVESPGGYRANVEAVTTIAPEPIDYTDAPAPEVKDTPVSTTIAALVDVANELAPKASGSWEAADTLKCVVLTAVLDGEQRQVFVVAVPGDRDVDIKRLEASIAEALGVTGEPSIEPATTEDIAKHAQLVPGYIGPTLLQDAQAVQMLGRNSETGIPFFVDPRIVAGSSWVTGANEDQKHVFGLIAERDFTWDGVLEATAVRDGDPAPDGSGPLVTRRGMEMGHIFQLGRKYAEALDLKVLDENGKQVVVTMGSYGIGISRAVAALAEAHHDDKGLIWPINVAPAHVHIVATGKDDEIFRTAEDFANKLEAAGIEVLYDDRRKAHAGEKFADAELIGVPLHLIVGRGLAKGTLELKDRLAGTRGDIPVDEAFDHVVNLVHNYQQQEH